MRSVEFGVIFRFEVLVGSGPPREDQREFHFLFNCIPKRGRGLGGVGGGGRVALVWSCVPLDIWVIREPPAVLH